MGNKDVKYSRFVLGLIGIIVLIVGIVIGMAICNPKLLQLLLSFLFIKGDGSFEWLGVSAIIAAVSYGVDSKFKRDKLKADTVSKSRIEWIQATRRAAAAFIAGVNERRKQQGQQEKIDDSQELGALLKLYFGPDESKLNDKIVGLINEILENPLKKGEVEKLANVLRKYFKNEWKRSINEIDDKRLKKMEDDLIKEFFCDK